MSAGSILTRRERSVVAALADTMVAPVPPLPAVAETDTVDAFAAWLAVSPVPNRVGLRGGLAIIALAPFAFGERTGLAGLDRARRTAVLRRVERSRVPLLRALLRALTSMLFLSYYGDDAVMRLLGYDADANVARGRRLIAEEGRAA